MRRAVADVPPIKTLDDLVKAMSGIIDSMSRGIISAKEAQAAAAVLPLLKNHRKSIGTPEERRIAAIEATRQPLIISHINARA
jgi:hypothetical protein